MLSERQLRAIIQECELELSKPLNGLKHRLRRHSYTSGNIFELLVLYGAIFLGRLEYADSDESPDVCIECLGGEKVWLEASLVSARDELINKEIAAFPAWLLKQLRKEGIDYKLAISLDRNDARLSAIMFLPRKNEWNKLLLHKSWKAFLLDLREDNEAIWEIPFCIAKVKCKYAESDSSSRTVINPVKHPADHPIYRAIKEKAKQAKRWLDKGKVYPGLVLVLGTEDLSGQVDLFSNLGITAEKAIFAALLDKDKCGWLRHFNAIGFQEKKRIRVPNSELISGVLFARLMPDLGAMPSYKKKWMSWYYANPHSLYPLADTQINVLKGFSLNKVEYGPGWEAWRKDTEGNPLLRARLRGGRMVMRGSKDEGREFEMPAILVLRILAGDITAKEAFAEYGESMKNPFEAALAKGQEITCACYIETDPLSREEPRISFKIGPNEPAIVRDKTATICTDHNILSKGEAR